MVNEIYQEETWFTSNNLADEYLINVINKSNSPKVNKSLKERLADILNNKAMYIHETKGDNQVAIELYKESLAIAQETIKRRISS
jgi:hypothetical protein